MKNILWVLLLFVVHFSFAQKLVGVYTSRQGPGIYEYNLSTYKCEIRKPIPSELGIPNQIFSGICHLNNKVYGMTYHYEKKTSNLYEYDLNNKEYKVVYSTKTKDLGCDLNVSSTGLLYGTGYDSIKGVYLFELDPISTVYKEYYSNIDFRIAAGAFVVMAKNDKMYFVCYKTYDGSRFLIEVDIKTKVFTIKSSSDDLPFMFMYPFFMSDIGDGKIACRSRKETGPDVLVYDYIKNTTKLYQNKNLKKSYSAPQGEIIRKGQFLYVMVTCKSVACLLSINIETGDYAEVADFGKIKSNWGILCFASNDVIYTYDFGFNGMIYGYNLATKKIVVIKEYEDNAFKVESELILAE